MQMFDRSWQIPNSGSSLVELFVQSFSGAVLGRFLEWTYFTQALYSRNINPFDLPTRLPNIDRTLNRLV